MPRQRLEQVTDRSPPPKRVQLSAEALAKPKVDWPLSGPAVRPLSPRRKHWPKPEVSGGKTVYNYDDAFPPLP